MAPPNLIQLAEHISTQAAAVASILQANNTDANSVQTHGYPTGPGFENLQAARQELLKAASDLEHLVLGHAEWLKVTFIATKHDHVCYHVIDHFKLYKFVPLEGEIPYSELSNLSGVPIDPLQRIVRHAMLNKLFCEPRPGFVAHSETSALLAKDKTLASWLGHNYDEVFMSSYALSDALTKYPGSSEPGETAFAITFKQPKGIFRGLFTEQPWRAARFEEAMRALLQGSHDASHLVVGYDWSKHGDGLVVDVGGSSGLQSVPVARSFPQLRFIVQDTVNFSAELADLKVGAGVKSDMEFQVHDFFTPNPVSTADVYLLRHILHDWGDKYAIEILRNISRVMKQSARILIVDAVMPQPGSIPWQLERMFRSLDLQMMIMLNGKERTKEQWAELFSAADKRLRVLSISQPPHSASSIIEVGF